MYYVALVKYKNANQNQISTNYDHYTNFIFIWKITISQVREQWKNFNLLFMFH